MKSEPLQNSTVAVEPDLNSSLSWLRSGAMPVKLLQQHLSSPSSLNQHVVAHYAETICQNSQIISCSSSLACDKSRQIVLQRVQVVLLWCSACGSSRQQASCFHRAERTLTRRRGRRHLRLSDLFHVSFRFQLTDDGELADLNFPDQNTLFCSVKDRTGDVLVFWNSFMTQSRRCIHATVYLDEFETLLPVSDKKAGWTRETVNWFQVWSPE